jgi:hypothetical protein
LRRTGGGRGGKRKEGGWGTEEEGWGGETEVVEGEILEPRSEVGVAEAGGQREGKEEREDRKRDVRRRCWRWWRGRCAEHEQEVGWREWD